MVGEDPERVDVLLQMDVGTADDVENVQMNDVAHHYNVAPHGVTLIDEFRDAPRTPRRRTAIRRFLALAVRRAII